MSASPNPPNGQAFHPPGRYVEIIRTGAYLLMLNRQGMVFLGKDVYRNNQLTLPGGNIVQSDRNLFAAAKRETRQEFGGHLCYLSNNLKPLIFLCDVESDKWIRKPQPGQKVKLRVVFPVITTTDAVPRQQSIRPEVLDPRAYHVHASRLKDMHLRESTRIALTMAIRAGIISPSPVTDEHAPDLAMMRQEMEALLIPPSVIDFHCAPRTRRLTAEGEGGRLIRLYLARLESAHREHHPRA